MTDRRRVLEAGFGLTLATLAPARAQSKWSQAAAEYQATPKDAQTCGQCTRFRPPSACDVVEGTISRYGWCKLFDMVD
jgi:hypothetical protein